MSKVKIKPLSNPALIKLLQHLWMGKRQFLVFVTLVLSISHITLYAQSDEAFEIWLDELREEASKQGISDATIATAFQEITPPVQRIIENDRSQPEVVQTYGSYLDARVSEWKEDNGQVRMDTHEELLNSISNQFGVQARFIVSIWGMETNYGTFPIREPIFNVLATLAYDNRRAELFRAQFFAALTMLDSGFPPYEQMKSSWAGAMGQTQFIPESYLRYAVDFDQDGRKDIWNTDADVFASIANYFKALGWRDDQTWGRKVLLPSNGENTLPARQSDGLEPDQYCKKYSSLGVWRDLQEWQKLGVRRADGSDLPTRSMPAALVIADSGDDEAFIVYRNFCSIMGYNPSFKYALSIGLLSDLLEIED